MNKYKKHRCNKISRDKVRYRTKKEAKRAVIENLEKYGAKMRFYRCRCGDDTNHYHLATVDKQQKRKN